jgi:hypothetical protein
VSTPAAVRLRRLPRPILEALRSELGPRFVNDQQRVFFDSEAPEVLYSGAFRAGKSRIGAEKALSLARRYPGIPIGIFRKTAVSLYASTERTLLVDVLPRAEIARSNASQHWYELANGSRIWLFGLDPDPITGIPSKVGSVELGWAFVDEAAECSEADWVMVKGRLSWPGISYHQITAATNPAAPGHWLKRRFTPPSATRVYLHASTFDNPALAADYVAEARASPDDHYHRRYHLGLWVAAEGQIWLLPDDQVREPEQTVWRRVVGGIDWVTSTPSRPRSWPSRARADEPRSTSCTPAARSWTTSSPTCFGSRSATSWSRTSPTPLSPSTSSAVGGPVSGSPRRPMT